MRLAAGLLALALAAPVGAQDYLGGVWPGAVAARASGAVSGAVERVAAVPGERRVEAAWYIYSLVPEGAVSFQWGLTIAQESFAAEGEHTPLYTKAVKRGRAPMWGAAFETSDFDPIGMSPAHGIEVGLFGARRQNTGAGILLVVGRSAPTIWRDPADTGVATIRYGLHVVPNFYDAGRVRLTYGVRFELPCDAACVSMQGGSAVQLSDDPVVPLLRFDPQTGFLGWWRGRLCVWCVHAVTAEVATLRQF